MIVRNASSEMPNGEGSVGDDLRPIRTCHAAPMLRSNHAVVLQATAQGRSRETACFVFWREDMSTCIIYSTKIMITI